MKKKHHVRKFLNERSGTAFIEVHAEAGNEGGWNEAEVKLSDCSRTIFLDFAYCTEPERRRALKKLERIGKELSVLHAFIKGSPLVKPKRKPKVRPVIRTV